MLRKLMRAAVLSAVLCALGAVTASAAFAAGEFTVESAPSVIRGAQASTNVFEVTNTTHVEFVKVKCTVATFEGEAPTVSGTTLTVTPNYEECTLGGQAVTVSMNGCKYRFNSVSSGTASVNITGCTEVGGVKKTITIVKSNCTITVPEQGPLSTVTFTNAGSGTTADSLATANISTITNTQTGTECPAPGLESSDGKYTGTVTVKAFKKTGSEEKTVKGHTFLALLGTVQDSFKVD
jgi:hypothetical protein